jgi:hypothetical protein
MKPTLLVLCALALGGCTLATEIATQQDANKAKECLAEAQPTAEGQLVYKRIWKGDGDGTDAADKLTDPKPLTPAERDALVKLHGRVAECRMIIISHDNKYAAWETRYWQEYFQRSDQIFYKLASGEIPVGLANNLYIQSTGQFQTDISKGHADAVPVDEAQSQHAAEMMLQASAQLAAAQPRMSTTNCSWAGNNLNCIH